MSSRTVERRVTTVASWLVLACLLFAGCATVPTSGPVQTHAIDDQQVNSTVEVAPIPPVVGASQMLIVEGFLHAMATDNSDFAIARQYLTADAAGSWHPESGAQIYADGSLPAETESSILLVAPVTGRLDRQGSYHESADQLHHDFELVKDASGEWRISRPPDGLLISRYAFTTGYARISLTFLDATESVAVPDPRYFPQNTELASTVIRAQLAGAGAWLLPAVRNGFDHRPQLLGLERLAGHLQITLDAATATLPRSQRDTLLAELTLTAIQLTGVTSVEVAAGGTALTYGQNGQTQLAAATFAQVAAVPTQGTGQLYAVRGGTVYRFTDPDDWSQADPVAPSVSGPRSIAVDTDAGTLAAVSTDGTTLLTSPLAAGEAKTLLTGSDLQRPDYSRQGELWVADSAEGAGFRVFDHTSTELTVTMGSDVPPGRLGAFRLSPDGVRIAVVVHGKDSDQLGIARVQRTANSVTVGGFRTVSAGSATEGRRYLDVGWTTATELLVLVAHSRDTVSVVRVDQDSAQADDIGPGKVAALSELAVVPGRQAVVRSEQALYRYEGDFNWKLSLSGVDTATYSR